MSRFYLFFPALHRNETKYSLHLLKSPLNKQIYSPSSFGEVRSKKLTLLKKPSLTGGLVPKNKLKIECGPEEISPSGILLLISSPL